MCYVLCPSAYEYKQLLLPGSAQAVVISAVLLLVVQFPVIKYDCFSCTMLEFTASSSSNIFLPYFSRYIYFQH